MKVQKQVRWLLPYLESVSDLIPARKIRALKGYKVSAKKYAQQYGSCVKEHNGQFTINMRLYRYDEVSKVYLSFYLGHLLETFAHELSHCIEWNHTPRHIKYTGIILSRFAKVLKKQGITDTYKNRMKYE